MTYKDRTLKAWKELAEKYRTPRGETFFSGSDCPTCLIWEGCCGCPMKAVHCLDFATARKAQEWGGAELDFIFPDDVKTPPEFIARAKFFEKTLPMLEKVPAKYFTPSGWTKKVFAFLDRSW